MEWNEYKILSEKTLSTEFHCGKQVENLLHGVVGIITELEELIDWNDEVNKKEEVADIFWYLALIDRELNINFQIENYEKQLHQVTNEKLIMQSFKTSSKLLDDLKKKIFYNKLIDEENFVRKTKNLFDTLGVFCYINNIEINDILDKNIAKLKARYGEKFSTERAIKRDLEKERVILEG
jgi:hypothetical protein